MSVKIWGGRRRCMRLMVLETNILSCAEEVEEPAGVNAMTMEKSTHIYILLRFTEMSKDFFYLYLLGELRGHVKNLYMHTYFV